MAASSSWSQVDAGADSKGVGWLSRMGSGLGQSMMSSRVTTSAANSDSATSSLATVASLTVGGMSFLSKTALGGASVVGENLTSALGYGPGAGDGHYAAEIALGLMNAVVDLMSACKGVMAAELPQVELAMQIDSAMACRSLNDLGARLLEFWYTVRMDALSPWGLHLQSDWVKMCYLVKYGDLKLAPGMLARIACALVWELGDGFRPEALSWELEQAEAWAAALQHIARLVDEMAPPPGWVFPTFAIARQVKTAFDAPTFYAARADAKAVVKVKAASMLAELCSAGCFCPPRPERSQDELVDPDARRDDFRQRMGTFEEVSSQAGDPVLGERMLHKAGRWFNQKTRPLSFLNQTSAPLKICLFSEDDKLYAVPVGGVGGPCVVTVEPTRRAQLRPPGSGQRFQLKVLSPGLVDSALYYAMVDRGASVQLRSHDCVLER